MLSYKEMDNLAAVEIEISARVSTEEFDRTAKKLEAFIGRHGRVRVLEIVNHFEGMDAKAFWHDLKFSLRHLNDFSRCAIVSDTKFVSLWSTMADPFIGCQVAYFKSEEVEAARDWLLWPEGAADII
jgi:SpoIIAA-like